MIDNSILIQNFLIKLELYFESYEFSNFNEFFEIFLNLFNSIFYFKIIKNQIKNVIYTAS